MKKKRKYEEGKKMGLGVEVKMPEVGEKKKT